MVDPVATVVCAADVASVDTVLVGGVVRKRHGKLTGYDGARVGELAVEANRRVLNGQSSR
jgi:hypothetical protein